MNNTITLIMSKVSTLKAGALINGSILYFRNFLFKIIFRYNKWHLSSKYFRPYLYDLIEHINDRFYLKKLCVVDIGCGNGELLRSLKVSKASELIGIDVSESIIKYAKFLDSFNLKKNILYFSGSMNHSVLKRRNIDLLILINWTHSMNNADMCKMFRELLEKCEISEIIVDYVEDYKNHDFEKYSNYKYSIASRFGDYSRGRSFYTLKKCKLIK
jgi:SAM-dependent methyltransferase